MRTVKRFFKRNSHNQFFKALAGFGRALNRLYENRNHDVYSNGELTVLKKLSKLHPAIIIDGGANTGGYTKLVHQLLPKVLVYAFEPVSDTFETLKQNLGNSSNVITVNKGFYVENCTKEINIFPSLTHSSIVDIEGLSYASIAKQTVELIRGDNFLRENKIEEVDFLKLDIEGAEYDAILGFDEYITEGKIKMIQFEYGYINISTKKLLIDFYNYFESKGYVVGKVFPKSVKFRKYDFKYEDFLGPNFIAVKGAETELINLLRR